MKANSKRKVFGDAVDLLMGDIRFIWMPMRQRYTRTWKRIYLFL